METIPEACGPNIQILDEDRRPVTESELAGLPKNGVLVLNSDVDATVDVSDQYGFCYRRSVVSGTDSRITDLKLGMSLIIRQGLDIVRTISIKKDKRSKSGLGEAVIWNGKMVQFPRRYAGILRRIDPSSNLYVKILNALHAGQIPENGLKSLIKLLEVDQHVR